MFSFFGLLFRDKVADSLTSLYLVSSQQQSQCKKKSQEKRSLKGSIKRSSSGLRTLQGFWWFGDIVWIRQKQCWIKIISDVMWPKQKIKCLENSDKIKHRSLHNVPKTVGGMLNKAGSEKND